MRQFNDAADGIAEHYEHGNFGKAVREITALADLANQYIASHEPWNMVKDPERKAGTAGMQPGNTDVSRADDFPQPILPQTAERTEAFFGVEPLQWNDLDDLLNGHRINPSRPCCNAWKASKWRS